MNPNESKTTPATPAPTSIAPGGTTATPVNGKAEAPRFVIEANSPRELLVKVTRAILLEEGFMAVEKTDEGGKVKSKYAIWNMNDDGKITTSPYPSLTLTPEEGLLLPTEDGLPAVLGVSLALKQLGPKATLASRIAERQVATATRSAANASKAQTDDLLAELRRRGVKV